MKAETKEILKQLLTDSVKLLSALQDRSPRRAMGTMLYASATVACMENISKDDFIKGCHTAWDAASEMNSVFQKVSEEGTK